MYNITLITPSLLEYEHRLRKFLKMYIIQRNCDKLNKIKLIFN